MNIRPVPNGIKLLRKSFSRIRLWIDTEADLIGGQPALINKNAEIQRPPGIVDFGSNGLEPTGVATSHSFAGSYG